ncbi:MAG: HAD family hydrolase [Bacilli bacterium]|nr:HAD family hydrolase [Bacilli bacterium]
MLKAIFFDLDDTLLWDSKSVSEAFKATCNRVLEKYNIDPRQLEKEVRKSAERLYPTYETYDFVKDIGIGVFEAMWGEFLDEGENFAKLREIVPDYRKRAWFEGLQALDIEDEQLAEELAKIFPEERKKHVYLFEETIEVLDALKGKYRLLMLTNGSPHLQKTKLSLSPELAPYFEHIVISGEFGHGKPSTELFNYALSLLDGVEKNEVIMVGDNPMTDILGASKFGIDSIWINHDNREIEEVVPTYEVSRLREILPIIKSLSKE